MQWNFSDGMPGKGVLFELKREPHADGWVTPAWG